MYQYEITVSKKDLPYDDNMAIGLFFRHEERYFNDLIKCRGYLYMNTIYENLYITWRPCKENVCILKSDNTYANLEFEVFDHGSYFTIIIHYIKRLES